MAAYWLMKSVPEVSESLIGCKRWGVVHLVPTVIFFPLKPRPGQQMLRGTPRNTFTADLLRLDSSHHKGGGG